MSSSEPTLNNVRHRGTGLDPSTGESETGSSLEHAAASQAELVGSRFCESLCAKRTWWMA